MKGAALRTLVERVLHIPYGGSVFIDQPVGRPAVVWLDQAVYTAEDAASLYRRLNGPDGSPTLGNVR